MPKLPALPEAAAGQEPAKSNTRIQTLSLHLFPIHVLLCIRVQLLNESILWSNSAGRRVETRYVNTTTAIHSSRRRVMNELRAQRTPLLDLPPVLSSNWHNMSLRRLSEPSPSHPHPQPTSASTSICGIAVTIKSRIQSSRHRPATVIRPAWPAARLSSLPFRLLSEPLRNLVKHPH